MGQEEPLQLHKTSPVLRLIQEIRNEAHRFAVAYHRKRRRMRDFHSILDDIPGIGPKRKQRLLLNFGSISGIRKAPTDELVSLVGPRLSETIKKQLAKG
jgi:excinuclease ABC subunit C